MKVAIFDVSHWHFPLYLSALTDPGIEIVGISDSASFVGQKFADQLKTRMFESNEDLLGEDFDFALVFSRHSDMAEMAERLINRGTPFLIEKPCGLNLQEVSRIRRLSEERGVYVSVPFILRVSDLANRLSASEGFDPEGFQHLSFRFIVGPVARYERGGCSWMLDKQYAGGGSTLNVGVHFIDLISTLTDSPITHVSAQMHTYRPDVTIEEQAVFTCRTAAGQIGVIETGYLYPSTAEDQRDFAFSISHADSYVRGFSDQFYRKTRDQEQGRSDTVEYNTDAYYSTFLRQSWDDLVAGRKPLAGLRQAEHAIAVVEAGYRSAANGGATEDVQSI
ncbi:Gfo/Idh/MocA family protein [Agrobacterium tumefaciens]|uniref:Gfo/Idh/MocA family protein n=1 Tax=Agrobacterium tumefaciens TaxID=358 RepID=UPI0015740909|nr:Gfo/Idh/MocA family oxidoreductase [Agrobacterium tumefaciens]NSY52090.1 Gfo/Idh/MocA family oxidoreductase [Agrobacterium tumefaciens]NTC81626.1 Gfo/Idh/MocA family oxidoreductase [Agrobacterium tumefaciens]NTD11207.1 Gfo/Idh/MocA family oxidoreductase [Agrobacterium tumefaciens]NTD87707.1 Gfo/Idh/MocA family oxidoreductase [Agrobacterium tumefaciens]NTD91582.1 Gfo/Idh/MocA family oxidoreductase [Agrobacterium tumefaciens]